MIGVGYQDSCHPYEIWGLNSAGNVFRYNYCTNFFDAGFKRSPNPGLDRWRRRLGTQ